MKRFLALLLISVFLTVSLYADPSERAQKTFSIPSNYQVKIDYLTGTNPIYIGYADKGVAVTDAVWFILKLTWDANNNVTVIQSANNAVWDDRAETTTIYN